MPARRLPPFRPVAALLAAGPLAACGPAIRGIAPGDWSPPVVASLDEVPGAQVLDARTAEDWAAGHVPGAAHVHWTEASGLDADGLWGPLSPEALATLLGERGLRADAPIVVYADEPGSYGADGDLYWTLRYAGAREVFVLGGGWIGWLAAGGEPSTADDAPPPTAFAADPDPSVLASTEEVAAWNGVLLDVRSEEEWAAGHIPGATWLPWTEALDETGALRDTDELVALFAAAGVSADTPVITYCRSGIRAGHTFLALEAAGVAEVRNYAGSWQRWTAEGGAVER